jgi:hypothetical protein
MIIFAPSFLDGFVKDFLRVHLLGTNEKGRGDLRLRDPLPINKKAAGRLSGLLTA